MPYIYIEPINKFDWNSFETQLNSALEAVKRFIYELLNSDAFTQYLQKIQMINLPETLEPCFNLHNTKLASNAYQPKDVTNNGQRSFSKDTQRNLLPFADLSLVENAHSSRPHTPNQFECEQLYDLNIQLTLYKARIPANHHYKITSNGIVIELDGLVATLIKKKKKKTNPLYEKVYDAYLRIQRQFPDQTKIWYCKELKKDQRFKKWEVSTIKRRIDEKISAQREKNKK